MSDIGNRMKIYEAATDSRITPNSLMIIRVDGHGFSKFTAQFEKPYDAGITAAMQVAAEKVFKYIQHCKVAYTQSDEISFFIEKPETCLEPYSYNSRIQKLASLIAAKTTIEFNNALANYVRNNYMISDTKTNIQFSAIFDARVFTMPKEEVANYFLWRTQDCERNTIEAYARSKFSHKELMGKSCKDQVAMLSEKGLDVHTKNLWGTVFHYGVEDSNGKRELLMGQMLDPHNNFYEAFNKQVII